jgi:hypothetical protein
MAMETKESQHIEETTLRLEILHICCFHANLNSVQNWQHATKNALDHYVAVTLTVTDFPNCMQIVTLFWLLISTVVRRDIAWL